MKVKVLVIQSCLTLSNSMNCSPPGSFVPGIFQARILEWVAIPFSTGSSRPKDWTWVSHIAGRFFTVSPQGSLICNIWIYYGYGLPWGLHQESICLQCRRCQRCRRLEFDSWVRKILWRKKRQPNLVSLPGNFHEQRSLARMYRHI